MNVIVVCKSIKRTRDFEKKSDDFGFKTKTTDENAMWVVRFEANVRDRIVKTALTYESEAEAQKWGEGKAYEILDWLQLAYG